MASILMLATIAIPLVTVSTTSAIELSTPLVTSVHAEEKGKNGDSHKPKGGKDGKNAKGGKGDKGKGDDDKSKSSSMPTSNKGDTSTEEQGNILDKPAADLGSQAAKDLVDPDEDKNFGNADKKSSDKKDKKDSPKASINTVDLGGGGSYNIGNAWSFMSSDNDAFWSKDVQGNASFNVTVDNNSKGGMSHYPSNRGKEAYRAMQDAAHLPFIMTQLGLDSSFSQGFNGQKHGILTSSGAELMELCYGLTSLINKGFTYVINFLNDFNPFNLFVKGRLSSDQQHFGPLDRMIYRLYDCSTSFGKTMMVVIFGIGITLAAMGIQVGQSSHVSQARGIFNSGIDIMKRAFIIICLPLVLATCYTEMLQLTAGLFNNAGYAPGNYAVYSTMTSFEDMVTHGRLNFSPQFLNSGLLPNENGNIKRANVTNAYLNHRSTLSVNADFNRSGAAALQAATDGSDYDATKNIFNADLGDADGKASAMNMLKDYVSNRTFTAADYVSQIMPGIPSKGKDDDKSPDKNKAADGSDLTDLSSLHYSNNGGLMANDSKIVAGSGMQGNSTQSTSSDLAQRSGGLSTIGMYNYLRSVTNGSSIDESSPYKRNNQVSDPKHFAVNFVGTGAVAYCNVAFAVTLMLVMAAIAFGTLWFILKAMIDSIPGSISGIIQGALGSLAGGARAVGALLGFFISIIVTGAFYQLSFRMIVGFIGSVESFFGANNGKGAGDVLTGGAIRLLGLNGNAPSQVVGVITLNAGSFAGLCLIESGLMFYLLYIFFHWRKHLITSLSAMVNSAFTRIMQSFGSLSGKGSYGMQGAGMEELAAKSGNAGISQMYNGAKSTYGMANKAVKSLTGGKVGMGTLLGAGAGAGMATKGLANLLEGKGNTSIANNKSNKSLKNSKSSDQKNSHKSNDQKHHSDMDSPKSAEDARQKEALRELADRQGDPLNAVTGSPVGSSNSLKDDNFKKQNGEDPMDAMDQNYSDQGQMQQLASQQGNAMDAISQNDGQNKLQQLAHHKNASNKEANSQPSPQDALSQVLAATGIQDPMLSSKQGNVNSKGLHNDANRFEGVFNSSANGANMPESALQRKPDNGAKKDQAHLQNLSSPYGAQSSPMSSESQQDLNDPMQQMVDSNSADADLNTFDQSMGSIDQSDTPYTNAMSSSQQQQDLMNPMNASQMETAQMQDPLNVGNSQLQQMTNAGVQNGVNTDPLNVNSQRLQAQKASSPYANGVSASPYQSTVSPETQQQNVMAPMDPLNAEMPTDQALYQNQDSSNVQLTPSQNKQAAQQINKVLGTNLSGQQLQNVEPAIGSMADSAISGLDNIMSGGSTSPLDGSTTITATGNGQAVVTSGGQSTVMSTSPGLNNSVAYGKGPGVMPGNVPLGMSVDPGYTSSGAGVIHGGLNNAMGQVQNASTRVIQANNAVKANPTNTILQQRAAQALQSQQQAQVQAMRIFNQTPALQTMSSLVNANTPSQISTGQVNQAVSDVYAKQQDFKQAATKFGPQSPQTQTAAQNYQKALHTARQVHIKSAILDQPQYLHQAYQEVRKQQMSIMDGSFKL